MTSLDQIRSFLSKKRIAFIGLSRSENDYSRNLFRELKSRGYDVIPVNPNASEIEGLKCFSRVSEVTPKPAAALILTTSMPLQAIMDECQSAGIKDIWVYNGRDKGKEVKSVEDFSSKNGINFIAGFCPFMFLENSAFVHKFHGFFARLAGSYPER